MMLLRKDACALLAAGLSVPAPGASAGAHGASLPWQPHLVLQIRAGLPLGMLNAELQVWASVKPWADK